jgi:hypothetical protein
MAKYESNKNCQLEISFYWLYNSNNGSTDQRANTFIAKLYAQST